MLSSLSIADTVRPGPDRWVSTRAASQMPTRTPSVAKSERHCPSDAAAAPGHQADLFCAPKIHSVELTG
jgi:hypothetical protein